MGLQFESECRSLGEDLLWGVLTLVLSLAQTIGQSGNNFARTKYYLESQGIR